MSSSSPDVSSGLTVHTAPLRIMRPLKKAGFDAYIVGGAVRDLLLSAPHPPNKVIDYDFATNAKPEELLTVFPEAFYENNFGTVNLTVEDVQTQAGLSASQELAFPFPKNAETKIIDYTQATKLHESLSQPKIHFADHYQPHYQITTFRSEALYHDHRRPSSVTWGETIEEDLSRRDFTIN